MEIPRARRRCFVPRLEAMGDRNVPSTFTVSNLLDDGPESLRAAVAAANADSDADVIDFAPGLQGTIALTSGQLNITQDLTINGPGENVITVSGGNLSRVFRIDGAKTDVVMSGLTIADGWAADVVG